MIRLSKTLKRLTICLAIMHISLAGGKEDGNPINDGQNPEGGRPIAPYGGVKHRERNIFVKRRKTQDALLKKANPSIDVAHVLNAPISSDASQVGMNIAAVNQEADQVLPEADLVKKTDFIQKYDIKPLSEIIKFNNDISKLKDLVKNIQASFKDYLIINNRKEQNDLVFRRMITTKNSREPEIVLNKTDIQDGPQNQHIDQHRVIVKIYQPADGEKMVKEHDNIKALNALFQSSRKAEISKQTAKVIGKYHDEKNFYLVYAIHTDMKVLSNPKIYNKLCSYDTRMKLRQLKQLLGLVNYLHVNNWIAGCITPDTIYCNDSLKACYLNNTQYARLYDDKVENPTQKYKSCVVGIPDTDSFEEAKHNDLIMLIQTFLFYDQYIANYSVPEASVVLEDLICYENHILTMFAPAGLNNHAKPAKKDLTDYLERAMTDTCKLFIRGHPSQDAPFVCSGLFTTLTNSLIYNPEKSTFQDLLGKLDQLNPKRIMNNDCLNPPNADEISEDYSNEFLKSFTEDQANGERLRKLHKRGENHVAIQIPYTKNLIKQIYGSRLI